MLDSIKTELDSNDQLLADFPEVCFPIQALDGISNRANGQLYQGKRTQIGWTAKEIVLPTIDNSPSSGAIIKVAGLTGRIADRYPDTEKAITTFGCPRCEWPSLQVLKLNRSEGQVLTWAPEAIGGRSGSSIIEHTTEGPRVVGLLTWGGGGEGLGQSTPFTATIGKTVAEQDTGNGLVLKAEIRDYLINTNELVLAGENILPKRGDQIVEVGEDGTFHVYEVLPIGNQRSWRYSDPFRIKLRIHTKRVGDE